MELTSQFYYSLWEPKVRNELKESPKAIQIMQAAERLFAGGRFHEITMEDVCRCAGVGKGTIYRYFSDKDDLFIRTAVRGIDELVSQLKSHAGEKRPFESRLLDACRSVCSFLKSRRLILHMMQSQNSHKRSAFCAGWSQYRKSIVSALADVLSAGSAEGMIRKDVPSNVLSNLLLGLLRTTARDLTDAAETFRRTEFVIEFFLRAAGPAPDKEFS